MDGPIVDPELHIELWGPWFDLNGFEGHSRQDGGGDAGEVKKKKKKNGPASCAS